MTILTHTGGIAATNAYLVADESTGQAVLFDAPDHTAAPLLDEVAKRNWTLIGLWLTHGHFDHIADHAIVKERFPAAQILIHPLDEPKLLAPNTRFFQLPFTIPPGKPDALIEDNQLLQIGNIRVQVIHSPGHSPGHVMFHLPDANILIGGDLIMMHSVGRTDLPDSSFADLQQSIRRVMTLPEETQLLPGHGGPSTLAEEKQFNPYVQEALGA